MEFFIWDLHNMLNGICSSCASSPLIDPVHVIFPNTSVKLIKVAMEVKVGGVLGKGKL